MTQEAMKQALEALEEQVRMANGWQSPAEAKAIASLRQAIAEAKAEAGTKDNALKLALQHGSFEQGSGVVREIKQALKQTDDKGNPMTYWGGLKEAEAETEQAEPVAVKRMMEWVEYLKRTSDNGQHLKIQSGLSAGTCWELAIELEQFIKQSPPQRQQEPFAYTRGDDVILAKHWTADEPPEGWEPVYAGLQRQWIGLTRAECLQIEKDMMKYYDYQHQCKTVCLPEFARAIEAKLKHKNGYAEGKNT